MATEIGAYEAKTRLAELLRGVQEGRRYTITHRGRAIAELVPAPGTDRARSVAAVDEMLRFIAERRRPVDSIRALIEEGRE